MGTFRLYNLIDRNFFERYGDVQAFGLNRAISGTKPWSEERPEIVSVMNSYVEKYGLYPLMFLVDLDGKVVADAFMKIEIGRKTNGGCHVFPVFLNGLHMFSTIQHGKILSGRSWAKS